MKKRRGAGNRGGRGAAGSGKRGDAKKPSIWGGRYAGKHGFTSKSRKKINAVNIQHLQKHIKELVAKGLVTEKGGVYTINLSDLKFNKLLLKGKVIHKFNITTKYASKGAVEKVVKAGGKVEVLAKPAPSK